jgi:hypothetical protein
VKYPASRNRVGKNGTLAGKAPCNSAAVSKLCGYREVSKLQRLGLQLGAVT